MSKSKELAELIAHYPRVRLCENVNGSHGLQDYLLSEADRYLIVKALRQLVGDMPEGKKLVSKPPIICVDFDGVKLKLHFGVNKSNI